MAQDIWPIDWPENAKGDASALSIALAERLAANTMRMLTLYRVGGKPITVMPGGPYCNHHAPWTVALEVQLARGGYGNCLCSGACRCASGPWVELQGPVGRVDEVRVFGEVLDPNEYHVENGNRLVRKDGKFWPACAGENFTVTYLNAYPVDETGRFAAGILAVEFLKAVNGDKKCRLPSNVTNVSRQGLNYELASGMFPDGTTGINEVDAYLMLWNPHGMRTRPMVYSPDLDKRTRQVTLP